MKEELKPFVVCNSLLSETSDILKADFDAKAYVEALTGRLVAESRTYDTQRSPNAVPFNAQPFIRAFETSLEELTKLRKQAIRKMGELEDSVQVTEDSFKARVEELVQEFDQTVEEFEQLESRISDVGNTAVIIGEQLDSLDKQRLRAEETKDLVNYFLDFNKKSTAQLDALKNSGKWESRAKAGHIIKRLNALAHEIDLATTETARVAIEAYAELYETELLDEFNKACQERDIKRMEVTTRILTDFNGGQSCMQSYVHQHEFFQSHFEVPLPDDSNNKTDYPLPELLNDFETPLPRLDRKIGVLYDDLREVVQKEWKTIVSVFPSPIIVVQLFLQRAFTQLIQNNVDGQLRKSEEKRHMVQHLRMLAIVHESTAKLVESIKATTEATFKDPNQLSSALSTLTRAYEDLFIDYLAGEMYIEKEKKCQSHAIQLGLHSFSQFQNHRKQSKQNRGMFSKLSSQPTGAEAIGIFHPEYVPSADLVLRILHIHQESLERCRELSNSADTPRFVCNLTNLLLEQFFSRYLESCLDLAMEDFSILMEIPRVEPDLRFMSVIQQVSVAVQAFETYFQSHIVPLVSSNPALYRDLSLKKDALLGQLESKLNSLMQKIVDGIMDWLGVILSWQKKADYRPKENANDPQSPTSVASLLCSSTCSQCCDYLKKVYSAVCDYLGEVVVPGTVTSSPVTAATMSTMSGNKKTPAVNGNVYQVLLELGMAFHRALLMHIKKFIISTHGGLLLAKDLAKYYDTVDRFGVREVTASFAHLKQLLGTLYVIKPEHLRSVLEEELSHNPSTASTSNPLVTTSTNSQVSSQKKSVFDPSANANQMEDVVGLLQQLIANRADYKQARLDLLIKGFMLGMSSPAGPTTTSNQPQTDYADDDETTQPTAATVTGADKRNATAAKSLWDRVTSF